MLERLETVMHSSYGGREYWLVSPCTYVAYSSLHASQLCCVVLSVFMQARKSMVYAKSLRETGNEFMKQVRQTISNTRKQDYSFDYVHCVLPV